MFIYGVYRGARGKKIVDVASIDHETLEGGEKKKRTEPMQHTEH